jgi:hypothetical protein
LDSLIRGASHIGIWPASDKPYEGSFEELREAISGMGIISQCHPTVEFPDTYLDHKVQYRIDHELSDITTSLCGLLLYSFQPSRSSIFRAQ